MKVNSKQSPNDHRTTLLNRLLFVLFVGVLWCVAILARLVFLQGFKADEFRLQTEKQQWGHIDLTPRRGKILDRNLEELARSIRSFTVYAQPTQIDDPLDTARKLAPILDKPMKDIHRMLLANQEKKFIYMKRGLTKDQAELIKKLKLRGVDTNPDRAREYPNGELACHLLGFVGVPGGLGGIEYRFDQDLRGRKARVQLQYDARRRSFRRKHLSEEVSGNIVALTIDRAIQHSTEAALRQAVESHQAKSGAAILMDPSSGEILSMASYPAFDPNHYGKYPVENRRNRAISDHYEPGSTFKVMTFAAVLNEGLGTPDEVIGCRVGTARLGRKIYHEAKGSFGDLTVTEILAKSSNVGTVKLGLRLGKETLYRYLRDFGFGSKTGVQLPGEASGLIRPPGQWSKVSIGAVSIGQEIAVTPLQMIRGVAAIANGGFLIDPHVVRTVLTPRGDPVSRIEVRRKRVLKASTTRLLKQIMAKVVTEGTGKNARLNGWSSAGKTGTAQKFVNGHYSKTKYVGSYIGFAPLREPKLIGLVVVDEPHGIPYGGRVAAPAFKEMMERALIHLRIPKDQAIGRPGTEFARNRDPRGENDMLDLEAVLAADDLQPEEASDSGVLATPLTQGSHQLSVNLDTRTVPDFKGKSLREVASVCARMDIQLKIVGSGVAVGQRPAAGTRISENLVCEVFFTMSGNQLDESSRTAFRAVLESSEADNAGR